MKHGISIGTGSAICPMRGGVVNCNGKVPRRGDKRDPRAAGARWGGHGVRGEG